MSRLGVSGGITAVCGTFRCPAAWTMTTAGIIAIGRNGSIRSFLGITVNASEAIWKG
ncbi:MAG TPA: hypothetical protein VFY67_15550 [Pyrinomonadaceae bacterium]|nr:hypothetical protein [Pyrinomonadaceae bacterium]